MEIFLSWPKMGYYIRISRRMAPIVRLLKRVFGDLMRGFMLIYMFFIGSMALVYMVIDTEHA